MLAGDRYDCKCNGYVVELPDLSGLRCRLRRSTQHHLISCSDGISLREPICLAVLGQNLARVVFRLI
jgi:hypothetical protein